jgi:UPF0716 protein FxsA
MIGLLLFVLLPIAELVVVVEVAIQIGVLNTVALLIVVSLVGGWLVKREGIGVLRRVQSAIDQGQAPHKEVVDGFLLLVAGVLLMVPGFLTDIPGLLLLLPPVRALVRASVVRSFKQRTSFVVRIVDGAGNVAFRRGGGVYDVGGRDVGGPDAHDPPPPGRELGH